MKGGFLNPLNFLEKLFKSKSSSSKRKSRTKSKLRKTFKLPNRVTKFVRKTMNQRRMAARGRPFSRLPVFPRPAGAPPPAAPAPVPAAPAPAPAPTTNVKVGGSKTLRAKKLRNISEEEVAEIYDRYLKGEVITPREEKILRKVFAALNLLGENNKNRGGDY